MQFHQNIDLRLFGLQGVEGREEREGQEREGKGRERAVFSVAGCCYC